MSSPVKILLSVVGAVLAIMVVAVVVIGMNLNEGVKRAIERYGPEVIGTGVHVDDVSLSLFDGEGELFGLRIDNPPGFTKPHALVVDRLKVAVDLGSTSTDILVLNELTIDSPVVYAEQIGGRNNLAVLSDNLEQAAGTKSSAQTEPSASELEVVVRHFAMRNPRAVLSTRLVGELTVELADVELENVGEGGGLSLPEFLQQVLGPITAGVAKATSKAGAGQVREVGEETTEKARGLLNRFKRD